MVISVHLRFWMGRKASTKIKQFKKSIYIYIYIYILRLDSIQWISYCSIGHMVYPYEIEDTPFHRCIIYFRSAD